MNRPIDDNNEDRPAQLRLGEQFGYEYLTKREIEVLKCVILGHSAKKIGHMLQISSRTVEGYVDKLKEKLRCSSKREICFVAMKSGLINLLDLL